MCPYLCEFAATQTTCKRIRRRWRRQFVPDIRIITIPSSSSGKLEMNKMKCWKGWLGGVRSRATVSFFRFDFIWTLQHYTFFFLIQQKNKLKMQLNGNLCGNQINGEKIPIEMEQFSASALSVRRFFGSKLKTMCQFYSFNLIPSTQLYSLLYSRYANPKSVICQKNPLMRLRV